MYIQRAGRVELLVMSCDRHAHPWAAKIILSREGWDEVNFLSSLLSPAHSSNTAEVSQVHAHRLHKMELDMGERMETCKAGSRVGL